MGTSMINVSMSGRGTGGGGGASEWNEVLLTEEDYNSDVMGFLIDAGVGKEIAEVKLYGQAYTDADHVNGNGMYIGFGTNSSNYKCNFSLTNKSTTVKQIVFAGVGSSYSLGDGMFAQEGTIRSAINAESRTTLSTGLGANSTAQIFSFANNSIINPRYFGIKNLWEVVTFARIRIQYRVRNAQ